MNIINSIGLSVLFSLTTGCEDTMDTDGDPPIATFLLVQDDGAQCPSIAVSETAFAVFSSALSAADADVVGIAEARVIEECSGAGGTHVFSSRTVEGKRFWLGRHACWLDLPDEILDSGVIVGLGRQTAGLERGEEGWCMNYPGENSVFSTDLQTSAMAWFANEAEATRFLEAL